MRIQDIELQTGLDRATIRFYEKEGLVIPKRLENGYRAYSSSDADMLLKIKLLRQLGISLSNIKSLEKGSECFSDVLAQQIFTLENQLQQNKRAKQVCQLMQKDGAQFNELDTAYYLQMLNQPTEQPVSRYNDTDVTMETHPIRRFIARCIDLSLFCGLIQFIFIVILRVRPWNDLLAWFVRFISTFAFIPIEAMMIHFWETTPGKWAMGIRLEDANGGKLLYSTALYRSFSVLFCGCGVYLPFIEIWCFYRSYRRISEGEDMPWDENTEVVYTAWSIFKKISIAVLILFGTYLIFTSSTDAVMPRYRNDFLTAEQFGANFRFYQSLFEISDQNYLENDGSWTDTTDENTAIVVLGGEENHVRAPFQYTLGDGKIKSIHYVDTWNSVNYMGTLPQYCECAVYAAIGSRPGINHTNLIQAGESFANSFNGQFNGTEAKDQYSGCYTFEDIEISWNISMSGIEYIHDGILLASGDESGTYSLDLWIVFL